MLIPIGGLTHLQNMLVIGDHHAKFWDETWFGEKKMKSDDH